MSINFDTADLDEKLFTDNGLLPCPFCGSKAEIKRLDDKTMGIICYGCVAIVTAKSVNDAKKAWNRRK